MSSIKDILARELPAGIPDPLPPAVPRGAGVPHAPMRTPNLTPADRTQALANALRYFDAKHHATLAPEFAKELDDYGHIYMYRLRPTAYTVKAYDIAAYPCVTQHAAAVALMVMNVLDPAVAMFPEELITYGGNGSVLSNWGQYRVLMRYLSIMTDTQTLALYSGHPHGLFPSHADAPRLVVSNGMMVPNYSTRAHYDRLYAMGVTQYGQMTAGSFCYIGSQGIVHGTTITLRNAGRKYLGVEDLHGKVYVTSGLGGMSGAQPKAAVICECISVTAEVDAHALRKRLSQGWVQEEITSLDAVVARVKQARAAREVVSIGYLGNVVDLWERFAAEDEMLVDLGSDQTSLHNPFNGGYYPADMTFADGNALLAADPAKFRAAVEASLRRHVTAINALTARGMRFWDYGNSFLLEASRAGADIFCDGAPRDATVRGALRYPSYVQDIMGDVFSLGFGPFRWVCTSAKEADLRVTDELAAEVMREMKATAPPSAAQQISDNILWIEAAMNNKLVIGSQARILYADCVGRQTLAQRFNEAVKSGKLSAPVVLSRDHHDVSGTDSPFRETSDIYDGSALCADMAIQNVIGDSFRGASWVAIHNGGGVGWGEVTNGGFGLVLDGSDDAARRATAMLQWDVLNGVARRGWAGTATGKETIERAVASVPGLEVTIPVAADRSLLEKL
jgi:urocanate hydratase